MKQFLKWGGLAILFVTLVMFVGCPLGDDEGDNPEVDWNSYTRDDDRAFLVRNNTSKRLVAFKGSISENNLLGGIPNNTNGHGIKKSSVLLNGSQEFPMILVTEEDYARLKKGDILQSELEQRPFTRVYVFYNGQGDNNVVYDISTRLGGNKIIEIGNNSATLNVEIRLGGINGETIGYAPAGMNITRLYVTEGDFDLFPVFKKYNPYRDVVDTIYPKAESGRAWFQPLGFDEGTNTAYFNVQDAINSLASRTTGVALLAINNQTSGAIRLVKGNEVVRTTTGVSYFNAGVIKTFTVDMPSSGINTFATSVDIASYKVGPNANEVAIKTTTGETNFTLQADYMYTVVVTGDHNSPTGLEAVIELDPNVAGGPAQITIEDW